MKKLTYISSVLLLLIGALGYFSWEAIGASSQSITAAIPAFVGILMLVGALLANRNHMAGMCIAVLFSLLGTIAGLERLLPTVIAGKLNWSVTSTLLVLGMTLICGYYTVMGVRFFIAARKARV